VNRFNQIFHIRRYADRNHLCKFWCGKKLTGQSLGSPIEMAGHPYLSVELNDSSCCAELCVVVYIGQCYVLFCCCYCKHFCHLH